MQSCALCIHHQQNDDVTKFWIGMHCTNNSSKDMLLCLVASLGVGVQAQ